MTTPAWPGSLPTSYAVDLELEPMDMRATFEPDVGEPLSRPRTTGTIYKASPTWYMTQVQAETFKEFYTDTLGQGSMRFTILDELTGDTQLWKFASPPKFRYAVKNFVTVSAEVMILPNTP